MFYEQLKKLCRLRGTSITALTLKLGLTSGNVGRWKKGGYPSIGVLQQMCQELNCSMDYLLGNIDDPEGKLEDADEFESTLKEQVIKQIKSFPEEDIPKILEYVELLMLKKEKDKRPR